MYIEMQPKRHHVINKAYFSSIYTYILRSNNKGCVNWLFHLRMIKLKLKYHRSVSLYSISYRYVLMWHPAQYFFSIQLGIYCIAYGTHKDTNASTFRHQWSFGSCPKNLQPSWIQRISHWIRNYYCPWSASLWIILQFIRTDG